MSKMMNYVLKTEPEEFERLKPLSASIEPATRLPRDERDHPQSAGAGFGDWHRRRRPPQGHHAVERPSGTLRDGPGGIPCRDHHHPAEQVAQGHNLGERGFPPPHPGVHRMGADPLIGVRLHRILADNGVRDVQATGLQTYETAHLLLDDGEAAKFLGLIDRRPSRRRAIAGALHHAASHSIVELYALPHRYINRKKSKWSLI